ncbi:MAG TPA: ABC transporter permease [Verrucomicrobiae bacterium]|nr:ABC transporter permease [Verrucomicrobiae bacterium]
MSLLNSILIGLKDVWAHKLRSLLTMLGIILGVASLVGMAAIVKGMENGMKENMITMGGADKVIVQEQDVPPEQEHLADEATGRTMKDVEALRESAPLFRLVSPKMEPFDDAVISRGEKRIRSPECIGVWPSALEMNSHTIGHGRMFNDVDDENARAVCVIGTGIRDALFGSPEEVGHEIIPIGETVRIEGQPFTVIGMFTHYESESERREREQAKSRTRAAETGPARARGWGRGGGANWAFWRKNNTVYIPLNTMWVRFGSSSNTNGIPDPRLEDVELKVADLEQMEAALQQARNVLMITHNGIEDFNFRTRENELENIAKQIRNARLSGGIIAAIALLVGGIGIMNIMLASINERIREIGICKAIGASGVAIFSQILTEGIVIAIVGALLGLVASYGLVNLIAFLSPTQNTPVITPLPMIVSMLFSAATGVIAGLYPAFKAARLDPIQALRYE